MMEKAVELAYDLFETDETVPQLPPILLLHGFLWNKYLYRDLAQDLCDATRRKVFCLDLRNHGESPWCDDCTVTLMIEDVKKFIQDRGLQRFSFACHSFANTIAYIITLEMPESVEKLLMMDSPPFNDFTDVFNRENVWPQLTTQNRLLKTIDANTSLRAAKRKFYELATLGNKAQEHFYKKAAYDLTKRDGQFCWKTDMDGLMERYRKKMLVLDGRGSTDHEILIVRCPNSSRVPDSKFKAVKKYNANARLLTLEGTTHLLMFEKQEEFVKIAADFFATST